MKNPKPSAPEDQFTPEQRAMKEVMTEFFELIEARNVSRSQNNSGRNYSARLPMFSNRHYNDSRDMDQQSQDFWDSLG